MITLSFVLSSILILVTPGPTNTVLATCGASLGLRRAAIMPLAEAMGYVLAISLFVAMADAVRGNATAFAAMKMLAASWLLYSAVKLWGLPFRTDARSARESFGRVFLTTLVNPKAMLVGTVLIPSGLSIHASLWVATYAALSTVAGLGWVVFGACLPLGVRQHSYKLASLVLGGFSLAAVASALSS
jgi:threonine/homoserine/homoserine lactone efflux protein